MPTMLLGVIFVLIAGVSLWDANRITTNLRRPGVFDSLGPDRYLMAVGVVLLVLGVALAVQGALSLRRKPETAEEPGSQRHVWLFVIVCAYAGFIWLIGYAPATLAFFLATLWIMGQRDWRWTVPSAVALTLTFFLLFEYAADISLPRGQFGWS
jgi:hypothetical protein